MTYCISDIHGEYDLFMLLLEKIRYSDRDRLIICGDFLDKGAASIRLTKAIFTLTNAYPIMGNHEYMFFKLYRFLADAPNLDFDRILTQLQAYFPQDGYLLDWHTVDSLVDLPYYLEEQSFICVHAGVPLDDAGRIRSLKQASPEELVYDRRFKEPTVLPLDSKCVFFGHTPTTYIQPKPHILAYPHPGKTQAPPSIRDYCKIHLDTGTPLSGVLGCFCVDTCQAFYVTK
jgi:serine/threonine protein phosphatase 1